MPKQTAEPDSRPDGAPATPQPGDVPPSSLWPAGLAVLVGLALLVVSIGLGLLATIAVDARSGNPVYDTSPTQLGWAINIGTLVQQASLVTLVWIVAGWRGSNRQHVLALRAPIGGWRSYLASFMALVAIAATMSVTIYMVDPALIKRDLQPFYDLVRLPSWWLTVIMVGIGAPLAEEILFRGFLFSALATSRIGVVGASLVTSAGWAALHSYSMAGLAQVFIIGLVFAAIVVRTGSLRVTILCHALYNSILVTVLILYPGLL